MVRSEICLKGRFFKHSFLLQHAAFSVPTFYSESMLEGFSK